MLSAIILVSMIYAFGAAPTIFPPNQTPFVSGMKTFSSLQELENYINNTSQGGASFAGGPLDSQFFGEQASRANSCAHLHFTFSTVFTKYRGNLFFYARTSESFSTTNVQVAGVDEADTVKTDGQYIYTCIHNPKHRVLFRWLLPQQASNAVYIVNADPQNPQVVSKIALGNDTEPAGLFLSQTATNLWF